MKKVTLSIILFSFIALSLTSCKEKSTLNEDTQDYLKSLSELGFEEADDGYYFMFTTENEEGQAVAITNILEVELSIKDINDSVYFASKDDAQYPTVMLKLDYALHQGDFMDAISIMRKGEVASFAIKTDSLFGNPMFDGFNFDTNSIVVFDVSLINISTEEEFEAEQAEFQVKQAAYLDSIYQEHVSLIEDYAPGKYSEAPTASGLKVHIIEAGVGPNIQAQQYALVDYTGALVSDRSIFDNSIMRGQPFELQVGVGQVIPGWDEGLQMLNQGAKALMVIPAEIAYGAAGAGDAIPPNADLLFVVEILAIQ